MEYAIQTRGSYAALLATAQRAEANGLACFALPDHYMTSRSDTAQPAYDNLAVLAGIARETSRIRLATLVSPITFRHPAVMAKNAITIDEMSDGRFTLGVGTGWLEREHEIFGIPFLTSAERWERMEEALGYIRAALTPGTPFEGKHYNLEATVVGPTPSSGLQLVVGGTGPTRTPTLAGRYADEYNGYPEPRDEMKRRIALARQAAVDAGRDPSALLISSSGLLVTGNTESEYRAKLEEAAGVLGQTPEDFEESMAQKDAPCGVIGKVREQLASLEEGGVERFYIQALGHLTPDELDELVGSVRG